MFSIRNFLKKYSLAALLVIFLCPAQAQDNRARQKDFAVKGFHLDLRIQVMTMEALRQLAQKLSKGGINTLIMEWEATYPFEKHPLIPNQYAYTKKEIVSFINYCNSLGIDVIPLQQSFGHVEYILRHERYKALREDKKDYSQVCPLVTDGDKALFTDLYTELISTHTSNYIHIGGDETYLLGHDARCKAKVEKEGKSKLYADYIKMLCDIVIKLGKRPVVWADIALKYPDAIQSLPKETIFVDWNYGWDMNRFGDHQKLTDAGFEIWGAPALRSSPDNYNLTQWEKHFANIHDFVPAAKSLGYKGIVMTSWSTSGIYSPVFESGSDIIDLYAVRRVYPLTGFNMLLAAYLQSIKTADPLPVVNFIEQYAKEQYGFSKEQTHSFWKALTTAAYEVNQGEVMAPHPMLIKEVLDSSVRAAAVLQSLQPLKNKDEFEHYRLMADIRVYYLAYETIEKEVNSEAFSPGKIPDALDRLKKLMAVGKGLDNRFIALNKNYFYASELGKENDLRNSKVQLLYERLSRHK